MRVPEFPTGTVAHVNIEPRPVRRRRQPVVAGQPPLLRLHMPGQSPGLLADEGAEPNDTYLRLRLGGTPRPTFLRKSLMGGANRPW